MNESLLTREALKAFAEKHRAAFEAELKKLVEIPSISADPSRKNEILLCAQAAAELFHRYGGTAEVLG